MKRILMLILSVILLTSCMQTNGIAKQSMEPVTPLAKAMREIEWGTSWHQEKSRINDYFGTEGENWLEYENRYFIRFKDLRWLDIPAEVTIIGHDHGKIAGIQGIGYELTVIEKHAQDAFKSIVDDLIKDFGQPNTKDDRAAEWNSPSIQVTTSRLNDNITVSVFSDLMSVLISEEMAAQTTAE